jgi:uncharacterized protein
LIAVDTNILVYAHRQDATDHLHAAAFLRELCTGRVPFGIAFHCLVEFFAVVTHRRIYTPPSTVDQALEQVDAWLKSPRLVVLTESGFSAWADLQQQILSARISGPQVHDARIAAVCLVNGVTTLFTADRDLSRFSQLATVNPLVPRA